MSLEFDTHSAISPIWFKNKAKKKQRGFRVTTDTDGKFNSTYYEWKNLKVDKNEAFFTCERKNNTFSLASNTETILTMCGSGKVSWKQHFINSVITSVDRVVFIVKQSQEMHVVTEVSTDSDQLLFVRVFAVWPYPALATTNSNIGPDAATFS